MMKMQGSANFFLLSLYEEFFPLVCLKHCSQLEK